MSPVVRAARLLVADPLAQDLALVAVLLASTALIFAGSGMGHEQVLRTLGGSTASVEAPGVRLEWWSATAIQMIAVVVRRRRPTIALGAAVLATLGHLWMAAPITTVDLAVPLVLYAMAVRFRWKSSLIMAGGVALLAVGWTVFVGAAFHPAPAVAKPAHPGDDTRFAGRAAAKAAGSKAAGSKAAEPTDPELAKRLLAQGVAPRAVAPETWGGFPVLIPALAAGWGVGSSVRSRRKYLDELRARARDLERERDQHAALAAAAERSRITRELHDVVAHGLSVMVVQAQGGVAALDNRPSDTREALEAIVETGRRSLADMRQALGTVGAVDDSRHPQPALAQIPRLVSRLPEAERSVLFHAEGVPYVVPSAVDLAAYRIVQEALTNTVKHGGPRARAQVLVAYRSGGIRLEIADDGIGPGEDDGTGRGLRGMRERVEALGGSFHAGPGPRGGFVVRADLPVKEREG